MATDNELKEFLEWNITPQNDKEQALFKEHGLVDDYIELKRRIPLMSREEVVKELNIQLAPYGWQIDEE